MRQPTTSPLKINAREHEEKAISLRLAGLSYQRIGDAIGITPSGAKRCVDRVLARIVKSTNETAEQVKQEELLRLDEMQFALYPLAKRGDIKATETILKIQQRRAKLLGLDAPEKLQVEDNLKIKIRWINQADNDRDRDRSPSDAPGSVGDIPRPDAV
jgi:hypothetical protein